MLVGGKVRVWPGGLEAVVKALEVDGKVHERGAVVGAAVIDA